MKICSKCNQRFEDGFNFCLTDGDTLVEETTDARPQEYQPPPFGYFPDEYDNSPGESLNHLPPLPIQGQMPSEGSGPLKSFGGLERLGPVGKLKRFFFGDR